MRKLLLSFMFLLLVHLSSAQSIREFSRDTGLFVSELTAFTGTHLETSEMPDFERFLHVYDSFSL